MKSIHYQTHKRELDKRIKNITALPAGMGCQYLITIKGEGDDLIAKQWKRTKPTNLAYNEVLINFGKEDENMKNDRAKRFTWEYDDVVITKKK